MCNLTKGENYYKRDRNMNYRDRNRGFNYRNQNFRDRKKSKFYKLCFLGLKIGQRGNSSSSTLGKSTLVRIDQGGGSSSSTLVKSTLAKIGQRGNSSSSTLIKIGQRGDMIHESRG